MRILIQRGSTGYTEVFIAVVELWVVDEPNYSMKLILQIGPKQDYFISIFVETLNKTVVTEMTIILKLILILVT